MITEIPFEELNSDEQNRLLRKIAALLRPMLGEIGEVIVKKTYTDITGNRKKPGFVGLLFEHSQSAEHGSRGILFAEYVDQETRQRVRKEANEDKIEANHIFDSRSPYLKHLLKTANKQAKSKKHILQTQALKIQNLDKDVQHAFRGFYGDNINNDDFEIQILVRVLREDEEKPTFHAALYFAFEKDDALDGIDHNLIKYFDRLVEQLIRNALGLAAISDHELRSAVSYLSAKLPQRFDDYVIPQTLAAIYAYVREVVPVTLGNIALPKPRVNWEDEDEANKLKSIHKASDIQVNRRVGGSLKGARVFSLKITTASKDDESTVYPAIAKFSTVREARDEADGLRKMQRYFSRIGKMLPPPLEVYLINQSNDLNPEIDRENWLNTECISVTPDLEGCVLSEKIVEHWPSPTRRVERFSGYLRQAKLFVDEIQRQPIDKPIGEFFDKSTENQNKLKEKNKQEGPEQRLINFVKSEKQERYERFVEALDVSPHVYLKIKRNPDKDEYCDVVNPIRWLKQMFENDSIVPWKQYAKRPIKTVLAHGDFHTGNLFYSTNGEYLTVLDYDRVAVEYPEEDFARLDASFVAFVFSVKDFNKMQNWNWYAPRVLSLLAGCHPFEVMELEENAFARDLVETLGVIRPVPLCPFYVASVVTALLIQLKTTYTKRVGKNEYELADREELEKHQGRNAAIWLYLAMMLRHLVEKGENEPIEEWNPFDSAALKASTPDAGVTPS